MKKTILLTTVILLFISSCSKEGKWYDVQLEEKKCSLKLPHSIYDVHQDTLQSSYGTTYMYSITTGVEKEDKEPNLYTFLHFEYPEIDLSGQEKSYLTDLVNRMESKFKAELINSKEVMHQQYNGKQARLLVPEKNVYIDIVYYVINKEVYGLQVVSKEKNISPFDPDTFFKSFNYKND